jgi:hypothetical protein
MLLCSWGNHTGESAIKPATLEGVNAMRFRGYLLLLSAAVAALLIMNCSDNTKPERGAGDLLSQIGMSGVQMPPNPLEGRQNPLVFHIRNNWTGGDHYKTGGVHYSHIKVFGLCWKDIGGAGWDPSGEQAEFIADHFDMYAFGGYGVANHAYPQYPSFLWLESSGSSYMSSTYDTTLTKQWIRSVNNEQSVTWDELVMHFKYDGSNVWNGYRTPPGTGFKGWNPSDDTDGDGCIEAGEGSNGQPSDSLRTAMCIAGAEIESYVGGSARPWWDWTEISPAMSRGYQGNLDMRVDRLETVYYSHPKVFTGCLIDNVAYNRINYGVEKTFTYDGSSQAEANNQYYVNNVAWVPAFAAAFDARLEMPMTVYIGNVVSPSYACVSGNGKEWFQEYMENCWDECWLTTGGGGDLMTTDKIPCRLNCPFLDYCEQGKGYVFTARSYANSYRERSFTLGLFYMINHQMAFFFYRLGGPTGDSMPAGPDDKVWDYQWNSYVPFDIGQPIVNTLGKLDFQGNANTNRYFVFASYSDCKILGRESMRSDGKRVLVLTKVMAIGETEGDDCLLYSLPKCYRRVQPDLSLGGIITSVALCNNDAAILVETTCPPGGGGPDPTIYP